MPYLNQVKKPGKSLIVSVQFKDTTKGDPGCFIECKDYRIFLWGESKTAKALKEILMKYTQMPTSFALEVKPNAKKKEGFELGKGESCQWFYNDGTFTTEEEEDIDLNDFF